MGIERYLIPRWYRELLDLEDRQNKRITREREQGAVTRARIAELEADLARVTRLAHALAELCLVRGLVTRNELRRELARLGLKARAQSRPGPAGRSGKRDKRKPRARRSYQ